MARVATEEHYGRGLARACAGAIIFSFPLIMTMEMWELGFYVDRLRLGLFVLVTAATVWGLASFAGFRESAGRVDDLLDAFAALAVGYVISAAMLALFGLLTPDMALREVVGMVAIQAAPASIGAIVADKQLQGGGEGGENPREERAGYVGQLFLMAAGALFLAFNVAPTEEMILIGYKMSAWHAIAAAAASLLLLHALVYTVGFAGQAEHETHLRAFIDFTLAGYGIALLVSLYILWTFGRLDHAGAAETVRAVVVLGFPAALGAAAARLLV
ncbi:TIGR02587 family membrane protein [Phenylobacterium sp. J367]|uniref:TIGR02587 family membrane protein n=1 Tax=Phenylobacterium sp. J367 TaxID=2898435 RepID=UPI00215099ED|nr:TIGR02587 family membrane protein [Phenylobacterium sp. J367]MCR5880944.1 TIGR02587 family membrane protein [Phenylobacterium sp. J367]